MPTDAQIISLLYKTNLGSSDTETIRKYFEEPYDARNIVYTNQIYSQDIPTTNPLTYAAPDLTISGVVQVVHDLVLTAVAGAPDCFYSPNLVDAIPPTTDRTNGTYNFILKTNANVVIVFGDGDWVVNPASGTLRFYGTLPSGVSAILPPKISFFKYVGGKGIAGGAITNAANIGTAGVGIFKNITSSTANFYKINSTNANLSISLDAPNNKIDITVNTGAIDHNGLLNLTTGDPHTQYILSNGRSGGQIISGGDSAQENLILQSTSNASKGTIFLRDVVNFGTTNVWSGQYAGKSVLLSNGPNDVVRLTLNSSGVQYVTLLFTMSAWSTTNIRLSSLDLYKA